MHDLLPFLSIIQAVIDSLDDVTSRAYQKNSKYYESTLQKLIDKLFQQENDEEEDGPEDKTTINLFNRSQ